MAGFLKGGEQRSILLTWNMEHFTQALLFCAIE